uniref:7TM_GPCR_Srx domain-containing protein n=1 Tax=Caenorhabditis tropicalis TaxID=1561998 RepID=A0A1I7V1U6_9PELO
MLLSQNFFPPVFETLVIIITVNLYMVNEFQTILIAVNRFIAIYMPLYYHKLFNIKVTAVCLIGLYIERGYSSAAKLYDIFSIGCKAIWSLENFRTGFTNSTCLDAIPTGFDGLLIVILPLAFFGLTIILNLCTFAKILKFYFTHNMDSDQVESVKKNIRLFLQTVLQDSLFFIDVLFTFKLSSLSRHRVWQYISTVLVWESIHMLDG